MIVAKTFSTPRDLAKFLRGEEISSGTLTGAITGAAALLDTAATVVADGVAVGDVVYISGSSDEHTVASGITEGDGSAGGVTLSSTTTAEDGAAYRICRGKIGSSDIIDVSYENNSANWVLIYDVTPAF